MAKSEQLRANKNQHVVKNALSKGDDKKVVEAMAKVIAYLDKRLGLKNLGYKLNYVDRIKLRDLIDIIKSYEKRFEFAPLTKEESFIKPDGGILILEKVGDDKFKRRQPSAPPPSSDPPGRAGIGSGGKAIRRRYRPTTNLSATRLYSSRRGCRCCRAR